MHTLELFEKTVEPALALLGDDRRAYDNDGNELEGSAWLPKTTIPLALMERVVQAGFGRIIDAYTWRDRDVLAYLKTSRSIVGSRDFSPHDETIIECLATEKVCAHYGELGTETSLWICSDAPPYLPDDPEERLILFRLAQLLSNGGDGE